MNARLLHWGTGIVIALFVTLLLTVPFLHMALDSDCVGVYENMYFVSSFKQFLALLPRPIELYPYAVNQAAETQSGYFSYFRPLAQIVWLGYAQLFGKSQFWYYVMHVAMHALTASVVYGIFTYFVPYGWAVFLALVFAFHPALSSTYLYSTYGAIPMNLFAAIAVLMYLWYFLEGKRRWLGWSLVFYTLALFLYEMPLIFPVILAWYFLLYDRSRLFKDPVPYAVVNVFYLIVRGLCLGMPTPSTQATALPLSVSTIFGHWKGALRPFWGIYNDAYLFAVICSGIFAALIGFYFMVRRNDHKKMIFLLGGFFLAAWIITLKGCDVRYFYMALPFFAMILYEVAQAIPLPHRFKQSCVAALLMMIIGWGGFCALARNKQCEQFYRERDAAFDHLKEQKDWSPYENALFIGTLFYTSDMVYPLGSGVAQNLQWVLDRPDLKGYQVIEANFLSTGEPAHNFTITPVKAGFRFVSPDPHNYYFVCPHGWQEGEALSFSMGTLLINKKNKPWQVTDMTILFGEPYRSAAWLEKTVILTWDMVAKQFVELPKDHLIQG